MRTLGQLKSWHHAGAECSEDAKEKKMDFSGLVSTIDLFDPTRAEIFDDMAKFQSIWLPICARHRPNLPWPINALEQWSRQWEYPYAVYHLRQQITPGGRVLDAGSGITFFPFYLALHGYKVEAADPDPVLASAYRNVNSELPATCRVNFNCADMAALPYADESFDCVCCISVFEHLSADARTACVSELARVLIPGGLLVLTLDLELETTLSGTGAFRLANFEDTLPLFTPRFQPVFPIRPKPPSLSDLLRTDNFKTRERRRLPWNHAVSGATGRMKYMLKKILGRIEFRSTAVAGFIFRKPTADRIRGGAR